jgi:hypothetical protein
MSFEEILLNAIDEEFLSIGETCQKIAYFYLKNEYGINRQEIPSKIKEFSQAIEGMFKDGGKILEIRIMENLFRKMGHINQLLYNEENLDFSEYIEAAKASTYHEMGNEKVLIPIPAHV